MASRATRRSVPLTVISTGFVLLWLVVAAFPFLWTAWGSFKVEGDFFSRIDWLNAIYGPQTIAQTGSAFTGDGYRGAWIDQGFWKAAINTRDRDGLRRRHLAHHRHARRLCAGALGLPLHLLDPDRGAGLPGDAPRHAWSPATCCRSSR